MVKFKYWHNNRLIDFRLTTNPNEAKDFIPYAALLFDKMDQARIKPQGLFQLKQVFYPISGVQVICHKIGKENRITIDVSNEYIESITKEIKRCFCSCGAITGWINQSPGSTITNAENGGITQTDDLSWIPEQNTVYEVGACQEIDYDIYEPTLIKEIMQVPTDFYRHFRSLNQGIDQKLDTLLIIQDKDTTITTQNGTTEQIHIPIEEVTPCAWDVFRVTSIDVIEAEITVQEIETIV